MDSRFSPEPPLKWAGGKRWLVPRLMELWQPYSDKRLVEPCVGGMAVALGLRPTRAWLNDINPHVMNFYRLLQESLVVSSSEADILKHDRDHFYVKRARFNELVDSGEWRSREAAILFYYLNRTCYNGLCRFNSEGHFNVPFGKYNKINYVRDFSVYSGVMSGWNLTCLDYKDMTLGLEPTDFIYADPPYDVQFTKYSKQDFTWEDQQHFAKWLARHSGPVVASNQATDKICELYSGLGFQVDDNVEGPRRISCNGDRAPAREMLATLNL